MANEISISGNLRYSKDSASAALATSFRADQTGDKYQAGIQIVGTSEENLDKGDVVTIGFISVRNADDTNFITLATLTATPSIKLKPGEGCLLRWSGSNVIAKANVAPCNVEYLILED